MRATFSARRSSFFKQYCALYGSHGFDLPALILRVYLHYGPYVKRTGTTLPRQRMDLLLVPGRRRMVLELDGVQHYARDGQPRPNLYAMMVSEDCKLKLKLAGYEVYRFDVRS